MTDQRFGPSPLEDHATDTDTDANGRAAGVMTRAAPPRPRATPARDRTSVFGPGAVLTARLPLSNTGANTADPHLCDAYTGPIMAIADQTPVICSAGVASPCGLDLLGAAGVPVSREIRTYRSTQEFHRLVGDVLANGERLLCQHVHDEDEVPADACLVAPPLLRYLNNKANLPAIVGREGAPRRTPISPEDVATLRVGESWVLKVCSDDSSGGGFGVYVHQAGSEIAKPAFVQPGAELIVEEYLELVENWCVHFCVEAIGAPRLIGATEQIISATGAYGGSRVGGTVLPPAAAALCQGVAERARELGFIGYCGIDTGLTASGELRVFDLNFRINASTPPLLVLNSIAADRRARLGGSRALADLPPQRSADRARRAPRDHLSGSRARPDRHLRPGVHGQWFGTIAAVGAVARRRRAGPPAADGADAAGRRGLLGSEPGWLSADMERWLSSRG